MQVCKWQRYHDPLKHRKTLRIFFLQRCLHRSYYHNYLSICKDLQNCQTIVLSSALLRKYFHLQCHAFVIYNASKRVPQKPSHHTVSRRQAANWQWSTSRRSVLPTNSPLPPQIHRISLKTFPKTEHLRGATRHFRCFYKALVINIINQNLIWHKTLYYWRTQVLQKLGIFLLKEISRCYLHGYT